MPVFIKDNKKVLFIHVPKCGGSSFEHEMKTRGWSELLSIRGVHANKLGFMKCSLQHLHAEPLTSLVNLDEFDAIVTIVREPFLRLRSEYYWQLKQKMTTLSPSDWIDDVLSNYENNNFIYDNHIRPQHEFIIQNSLIFKLEDDGVNNAINKIDCSQPKKSIFEIFKSNKKNKKKETIKSEEINNAFLQRKSDIVNFYAEDYRTLGYSEVEK